MPIHYALWEAVMCVLVLMSRKKHSSKVWQAFL